MQLSRRVRTAAGVAAGVAALVGVVAVSRQEPPDVALSASGSNGVLRPSSTVVTGVMTPPSDAPSTVPPPLVPVGAPTTPTTVRSFLGPPGTPGTTGSVPPRQVVAQSSEAPAWKLHVTDKAGKHCLELEVKGKSLSSLLCGAPAAKRPIGDLVVVDLGGGDRGVVAVAAPSVTHTTLSGSGVGADPSQRGTSYIAGIVKSGTATPVNMLVHSGQNTVARVVLPDKPGTVAAAKVAQVDTKPYGAWAGYRRAGYTGLFWGGNQELGFYDGPGGVRCVLYRRFGGDPEGMLGDSCPAKAANTPVPFAALVPTRAGRDPKWFHVLAVADEPIDTFTCVLPSGGQCGSGGASDKPPEPVRAPDPSSARIAFGDFVSPVDPAGAGHVTLIFFRGGTEVARRDVAVPA